MPAQRMGMDGDEVCLTQFPLGRREKDLCLAVIVFPMAFWCLNSSSSPFCLISKRNSWIQRPEPTASLEGGQGTRKPQGSLSAAEGKGVFFQPFIMGNVIGPLEWQWSPNSGRHRRSNVSLCGCSIAGNRTQGSWFPRLGFCTGIWQYQAPCSPPQIYTGTLSPMELVQGQDF